MVQQRAALVVLATLAVLSTGCGGGGGSAPPVYSGSQNPAAPSATSSKTITPAGGSVSTTLNNQMTVTITVPPGGLSAASTVTVTVYSPGQGPNGVKSAKRSPKSYTSGTDTLIADAVVDAGGATVLAPLQMSVSGPVQLASGSNAYVEGFNNGGTAPGFDDVAAASFANGAYTTTSDPTFPGLTLASQTEYVMYGHAGTYTGDGTIALNAPSTMASPTTITPTETTVNGFPYLQRSFTFSLTGNAGSVNPTTGTSTTFTPAAPGGVGTLTATDTQVTSRSATATITAASARPGAGVTATYTGTYTENDVNNVIGATPVPSVMSYTVATTISAAAATDGSGNTVFTSNESDNGGLKTTNITTNATVAYQANGQSTNVRTLKTVATDSNGVTYETDYGPNNGLQTVLPETNGAAFTNDAQLEYKETDPGIPGIGTETAQNCNPTASASIDRCQNSDGSYTQYNGALTSGATAITNSASGNVDFSGKLLLNSIPAPNPTSPPGRQYTFNAPSGGTITYTYYNPINTTHPSSTTVPDWIPSSLTVPSVETDTITTGQALDPSCAPGAGFTSSPATKVTQTITIADPTFGTLETRTTSSYDVAGPGTVCAVVSDSISTFYDYSYQEGPSPRLFPSNSATTPVEQVTIAQTISLQGTNAPGASTSSSSRSTKSVTAGIVIPRALLVAKVEHAVHQKVLRRLAQLATGGSTK